MHTTHTTHPDPDATLARVDAYILSMGPDRTRAVLCGWAPTDPAALDALDLLATDPDAWQDLRDHYIRPEARDLCCHLQDPGSVPDPRPWMADPVAALLALSGLGL